MGVFVANAALQLCSCRIELEKGNDHKKSLA